MPRKNLRMRRPVFAEATWDQVSLPVIKGYLTKRTAKTQGNREMALLSVIWNWARGEGLTALPWPVWAEEAFTQGLMQLNTLCSAEGLSLCGIPALAQGNTIAAMSIAVRAERLGMSEFTETFLMPLKRARNELEKKLYPQGA